MQLAGKLDSPYVRRVALSLETLGIPFEHLAISVFDDFALFQTLNPVVKAPTLICDDGTVLLDSSIILQFIDRAYSSHGSLWSAQADKFQQECRVSSLALAACDKAVQLLYERNLRPQAFQYEPWLERVTGQILAAILALEAEIAGNRYLLAEGKNQAVITSTVVWTFIQSMLAHIVVAADYPNLQALAAAQESTAIFQKYAPIGPGIRR